MSSELRQTLPHWPEISQTDTSDATETSKHGLYSEPCGSLKFFITIEERMNIGEQQWSLFPGKILLHGSGVQNTKIGHLGFLKAFSPKGHFIHI